MSAGLKAWRRAKRGKTLPETLDMAADAQALAAKEYRGSFHYVLPPNAIYGGSMWNARKMTNDDFIEAQLCSALTYGAARDAADCVFALLREEEADDGE